MILAYLLLLTGLTISAVAIYYSVVGLTAIFSAAAIPIIIMGSALEVGKLVCASWLKANWDRAPRFMKYYMTIAVVVLMLITSMGIFGFLSKAHNDQTLVSGDVGSKIAIYDEKIRTAKENIEADRKQLKQMDEAVDQIMGRSTDEKGADKANAVRKSQQKDRLALSRDIETQQKLIASLNDESAPIRAEIRKVEAEVGPIKYIASFIYGANPDSSLLERAVTWIIILIVVVFDPLAVIMLLAAQMTFGWAREQKETEEITPDPYVAEVGEKPTPEELVPTEELESKYEPDDGPLTNEQLYQIAEAQAEQTLEIAEAEQPIINDETTTTLEERLATGQTYINSNGEEETVDSPIEEPAEKVVEPIEEVVEEVVEPIEEVVEEVVEPIEEESKKKDLHDQGPVGTDSGEEQRITYIQNEEQKDPRSFWQRLKNTRHTDPFKTIDRLYIEYNKDHYADVVFDTAQEPELAKFINDINSGAKKFNDYPTEELDYFAEKIYELRKDNSNNSA